MAVKYWAREPTEADMQYLIEHMRQSDIDELAVTGGISPAYAVRHSVKQSAPGCCFAVFADEQLLGIGGCGGPSLLSNVGVPWLLATDALMRHGKRATRDARRACGLFLERWPVLMNMVDARNTQTIAWLRSVGFCLGHTLEVVPGHPVILFEMRR